jgi:hypothetical protein
LFNYKEFSMKVRLIALILGALCFLAVPSLAHAQGTGDDGSTITTPSGTVPDDGGDDQGDPSLEPPTVLDDPAPADTQPVQPAPTEVAPTELSTPPVNELSRFSDDVRAPVWQQRDNWRPRGLFYRWRQGWFIRITVQQQNVPGAIQVVIWFQFRDGRWTRCGQPGDWRPDVVRPVPNADPSPLIDKTPINTAVQQIVPPRFNHPVPTQQNNRVRALRRALLVCQVRYVRSVRVLRTLRQQGRITFRQYRQGVQFALNRRQDCRRFVFRHFRQGGPRSVR